MTEKTEKMLIETQLSSNWSTTTIRYENVTFVEPTDSVFVSLEIVRTGSNNVTLGVGNANSNALIRHFGEVQVKIITPIGTGTNKAVQYGNTIGKIFENKSLTTTDSEQVVFYEKSIKTLGKTESDKYVHVVTVPFYRDERVT